jgi:hypothetical protein
MALGDWDEFAFQTLIGSVILFGVYIGTFFALNQTQAFSVDINLFLNEFGVPFVAATVLRQLVQLGFDRIRA